MSDDRSDYDRSTPEPLRRVYYGGKLLEVERDPHGMDPHEPGAKLDAGKLRLGLVLGGFAEALTEVGRVGTYGAEKYSPNGWKSVENGEERYLDALYRHLLADAQCEESDPDSGLLHLSHACWNMLALLELRIGSYGR